MTVMIGVEMAMALCFGVCAYLALEMLLLAKQLASE